MVPVDPNLSLNAVVEGLEALEQSFSSADHSARTAIFNDATAVNHLLLVFLDVGKKARSRLNYYADEDSMKGLDLLWLRSLVGRFDSIVYNSKETGGFSPWLNETDGVEIWWMLRHGSPSLGRIRDFRSNPLSSRLNSLLKGDRLNALPAMQRLANSNRSTAIDFDLEALAGNFVLIAIDENCIDREFCSEKSFVQNLMESLSCSDDPGILFQKLASLCLPDGNKEKHRKRVPLRSRSQRLGKSIDLLANVLTV